MSYALRIAKVIAFLLISVIALLCLGALYQYGAEALDNYRYPAPGKLIDVGGYKLHIRCTGSGAPSVIIAAGGGEFSLSWFAVQDEIAKFTHVCTYDQGSSGWSEESPAPLTGSHIVSELHTLLANAGVPKPYILVGHSLGGAYMRLYTNTYPDDVYGVVLVDSSHELQLKKSQEIRGKSIMQFVQAPFLVELIVTGWIGQHTGFLRLYVYPHIKEFASWRPKAIQDAFIARSVAMSSLRANRRSLEEIFQELEDSKNQLQNKPLTVITAGKPDDSKEEQEHQELISWPLQKDLVTKSSKGKQIIAEKSGHMIHYEQPEIIVQAVRDMVAQYHKEKK